MWKKTIEELPSVNKPYLCYYEGEYIIRIWNPYDNCWDDEEGDDYYCDPEQIEAWTEIPKYEK